MKVKDLMSKLKRIDPNARIILQRDAEGNGYSPLAGADEGIYVKESTYSGDVYDPSWTADECDMTAEEHEALLAQPRCVVLYPIN